MRIFFLILALFVPVLSGCHLKKDVLGTAENPIKFHLVPALDARVLTDNSKVLKDYLEKNTPYKFQITNPQNFVAVVESFGTHRADVAAINTNGYYILDGQVGKGAGHIRRSLGVTHGVTESGDFICYPSLRLSRNTCNNIQ